MPLSRQKAIQQKLWNTNYVPHILLCSGDTNYNSEMMRKATIRVILKLIEEPQENSICLQKYLVAAQGRVTKH